MFINYGRVRLIGSSIIGSIIAILPVVLLLKSTGKPGLVIFFLPLAVLFTVLCEWSWKRGVKREAERRELLFREGRVPMGKQVDHPQEEK